MRKRRSEPRMWAIGWRRDWTVEATNRYDAIALAADATGRPFGELSAYETVVQAKGVRLG